MKKLFPILILFTYLFPSLIMADDYSIVFVHIGDHIPSHAKESFSQARAFNSNCPIYILAKGEALDAFFAQGNPNSLIGVNYNEVPITQEHKSFTLDTSIDGEFWLYASERFLYLYDFMASYNLQNVFHLENDVMLYVNLKELLPIFQSQYSGIAATFDNDVRCIPGFIYVSNPNIMEELAKFFASNASKGLEDMQTLAKFKNESTPSQINYLPIVTPEYVKSHPLVSAAGHNVQNADNYCLNIDVFDSIFDAAALGQYLGGIDTIHEGGGIPGFINESAIFNPSFFSYEWNTDNRGRNIPYIVYANKKYRINNLHIHSKKLDQFSSFNKDFK